MNFVRKEALRYLRAKTDDREAGILVDTVYLKMRNEVQAHSVCKRFKCQITEQAVILEQGTCFHSAGLARHLAGCDEVLLLGATLGSRVDACIRRLAILSVAEGAAAQAVGAALIESYLDELQEKWQKDLAKEGLCQKTRFSPGYGDWPLEEQKIIFPLLDCAKLIGLTLTDGCMMAPSKSVTAIIGLSKQQEQHKQHDCSQCNKEDCEFRKQEQEKD